VLLRREEHPPRNDKMIFDIAISRELSRYDINGEPLMRKFMIRQPQIRA
jgi:hypothetical protein